MHIRRTTTPFVAIERRIFGVGAGGVALETWRVAPNTSIFNEQSQMGVSQGAHTSHSKKLTCYLFLYMDFYQSVLCPLLIKRCASCCRVFGCGSNSHFNLFPIKINMSLCASSSSTSWRCTGEWSCCSKHYLPRQYVEMNGEIHALVS